jgi:hypothetical protein
MKRQLCKIAKILISLVYRDLYSANKGIHADPKSLAASGRGDARRWV